jgi:NAD(P)-dependent dehydrogenase (short-subunit alcohol dehydrogenase family)
VNQSSVGAYMGRGTHYGCSKLALIGLTQGLARELGPHGITVNAIVPGAVHTDATMKVVSESMLEEMRSRAPIPIRAEPSELVGTLRYLVGDGAAWVTGQTIVVDGGAVPRLQRSAPRWARCRRPAPTPAPWWHRSAVP